MLERHGTEVISTEELMHKIYTANTKIAERVRTWEVNKDRELRGREKPEIQNRGYTVAISMNVSALYSSRNWFITPWSKP